MNAVAPTSNAAAKLSPDFASALAMIHAAIEGMSDQQMEWHPQDKWSASEILEHLSLTYSRTADRIEPLLDQGLAAVRRRNLREWVGVAVVLKLGKMPSGRKAPELQLPRGIGIAEAKKCLEEQFTRLNGALDECERRFGPRRKIMAHYILGPLSTREYRRFHCVHTLHHLKQVRALRERIKAEGIFS